MKRKYTEEQRLRFIDFLLAQYGHINRSAIMDYFGVGEATATRDFSEYKKMSTNNMVYNNTDRTYYKTQYFERIWA